MTLCPSIGLAMFFDPGIWSTAGEELARQIAGLIAVIVGAGLLFCGLVGGLFKLVTDANIVAAEATHDE